MKKIKIAIDGPASSGKTTTAKLTAERLNYTYIDTGAMYRAATLAWLRSGDKLEEDAVCKILDKVNIELRRTPGGLLTLLNDEDVSEEIRSPEVTKYVSPVSAISCVREKLVKMQREMGAEGGVVLEGRDIGTVVFPQAELKIFLLASPEERARRRMLELKEKGMDYSVEEIKRQIIERDRYDSSREISPLRKAEDAVEIDTTNLTIQEQCDKIVNLVKQII